MKDILPRRTLASAQLVVTGGIPQNGPPGICGAWDSILHRLIAWSNPSTEDALIEHANSEFTEVLLAAAEEAGMLQSRTMPDDTVIWFFTYKGANRWVAPFAWMPQWAHLDPKV